jgi:hypothetical protein
MRGIVGAGLASLVGLLICTVPTVVVGAWFAMRPSERLLALMRPLTLAAIFSALCSFVLALANAARMASTIKGLDLDEIHRLGAVLSEGLAPVVACFACLTVAWACVALGMRRG